MSKFDKVNEYYIKGFWNITRVKNAVLKHWITEEEFELITGKSYGESEL